ncbi:MAG TPA: MFS transporter, partial [Paraburkholderia sp.]|nr:MFS transporter [Paraburkholderia sp.]
LPSYLNRFHGMPPDAAARSAAVAVLVGAVSSTVWGIVVGRIAVRRPRNKLLALSVLCLMTWAVFAVAFGGT